MKLIESNNQARNVLPYGGVLKECYASTVTSPAKRRPLLEASRDWISVDMCVLLLTFMCLNVYKQLYVYSWEAPSESMASLHTCRCVENDHHPLPGLIPCPSAWMQRGRVLLNNAVCCVKSAHWVWKLRTWASSLSLLRVCLPQAFCLLGVFLLWVFLFCSVQCFWFLGVHTGPRATQLLQDCPWTDTQTHRGWNPVRSILCCNHSVAVLTSFYNTPASTLRVKHQATVFLS